MHRARQGVGRGQGAATGGGGEPAVEGVAGQGGGARQGDGGASETALRAHRGAALGVEGERVGGVGTPLGVEGHRARQGVGRGQGAATGGGGEPAVEGVAGQGGGARQGDGGASETALRAHRAAALGVEGERVSGTAACKLGAVLIQSGQGPSNPTAIPAMGRRLRHVNAVGDPIRSQQSVVVRDVLLVVVVAADPNAVAGEEWRLVSIDETRRQPIVGLVVRIGAVIGGRIRAQFVVR